MKTYHIYKYSTSCKLTSASGVEDTSRLRQLRTLSELENKKKILPVFTDFKILLWDRKRGCKLVNSHLAGFLFSAIYDIKHMIWAKCLAYCVNIVTWVRNCHAEAFLVCDQDGVVEPWLVQVWKCELFSWDLAQVLSIHYLCILQCTYFHYYVIRVWEKTFIKFLYKKFCSHL